MQIVEAIQLIVHVDRCKKTGKRKITSITHVVGLDGERRIVLKDIFRFNEKRDEFEFTGYVPVSLIEQIRSAGVDFDESIFQRKEGEPL